MRAAIRAGQGKREKGESRPFNDGNDDEGDAPRGLPHAVSQCCCQAGPGFTRRRILVN